MAGGVGVNGARLPSFSECSGDDLREKREEIDDGLGVNRGRAERDEVCESA
jgi:hypothetical protein